MFSHLVILKRAPWYVYAMDDQDALEICNKYDDDVRFVVGSSGSVTVYELKKTTELVAPRSVEMIEYEDHQQMELLEEPKEEVEE